MLAREGELALLVITYKLIDKGLWSRLFHVAINFIEDFHALTFWSNQLQQLTPKAQESWSFIRAS